MNSSVLSTAAQRLSINDWGPLLFPRYGSGDLLAFYMDDSTDQKRQQVFVVAGFLGDTETWFDVERHWNRRLERDGLDYFRASEFNSMTGEFEKLVIQFGNERGREVASELVADLKLIVKSAILGAFCFMGSFEPYRAVQGTEYGQYVLAKDPYLEAHQQIIYNVAKNAAKNGIRNKPIAFVIDEHMKAKDLLSGWEQFKSNCPTCAPWMGSLTQMDDKICAPVQVADLIANTTKKAYQTRHGDPNAGLAELSQWSNNLLWVAHWNEEYLTALVDASIDAATSPAPIPSRRIEDL